MASSTFKKWMSIFGGGSGGVGGMLTPQQKAEQQLLGTDTEDPYERSFFSKDWRSAFLGDDAKDMALGSMGDLALISNQIQEAVTRGVLPKSLEEPMLAWMRERQGGEFRDKALETAQAMSEAGDVGRSALGERTRHGPLGDVGAGLAITAGEVLNPADPLNLIGGVKGFVPGAGLVANKVLKGLGKEVAEEAAPSVARQVDEALGPDYIDDVVRKRGEGPPGISVDGQGIVFRDENGQPLGGIIADWKNRHIKDIAVVPEARKRGIATQLDEAAAKLGLTRDPKSVPTPARAAQLEANKAKGVGDVDIIDDTGRIGEQTFEEESAEALRILGIDPDAKELATPETLRAIQNQMDSLSGAQRVKSPAQRLREQRAGMSIIDDASRSPEARPLHKAVEDAPPVTKEAGQMDLATLARVMGTDKEAVAKVRPEYIRGVVESTMKDTKKASDLAKIVQGKVPGSIEEASQELDRVLFRMLRRKARAIGGEQFIDKLKGVEPLTSHPEFLEVLSAATEPTQIYKTVKAVVNPKLSDHVVEFFVNNILSGPHTHARNLIGNGTFALVEAVGVVPTKLALGKATGKYTLKDAGHAYAGMYEGLRMGFRKASEAWRRGVDVGEESLKGGVRHVLENSPYRILNTRAGKAAAKFSGWPTRALRSMDALFKSMGHQMKLHELASIHTRANLDPLVTGPRKLSPDEYAKRFKEDFAKILEDPPDDLFRQAVDKGEFMTFTDEVSDLGKFFYQLRDAPETAGRGRKAVGVGAKFIFPFVRTMDRLVARGYDFMFWNAHHAAGLSKEAMTNPQTLEQLDKAARGIFGGVMTAGLIGYVAGHENEDGLPNIIGHMPKNAAERDRLYAAGVKPFSIRIGNRYRQFNQMEPMSFVLAAIAAVSSAYQDGEDGDTIEDTIEAAVATVGSVTEKSMIQGLSDLLTIIDLGHMAPNRGGALFTRLASGLVPQSGMLNQLSRVVDPTLRETPKGAELLDPEAAIRGATPDILEKVYNAIAERTNLPEAKEYVARYTPMGEEPVSLRSGSMLGQVLGPSGTAFSTGGDVTEAIGNDPVYQELRKLGVKPKVVGNRITVKLGRKKETIELDDQERALYMILAGRPARKKVEEFLSRPDRWDRVPLEKKRELVQKTLDEAQQKALEIVKNIQKTEMHPSLTDAQKNARLKAYDLQIARMLGLTTLEDLDNREDRRVFLNN